MRLLGLLAVLLSSCSAGAQMFPVPGPGHLPWTATAGGGGTIASCTDGVDCYCDRVSGTGPLGTGDPIYRSDLVYCEDFEHPGLRLVANANNWAAGGASRGSSSAWTLKYGNGATGGIWKDGEPTSPTNGSTCSAGGPGNYCPGQKVWDTENKWSANSLEPWIQIIDSVDDFTAEVPTAGAPTIPGTSANFDGLAMLAYRNGPGVIGGGDSGAGGIINSENPMTGGAKGQLGFTAIWGYDANVKAWDVLQDAWKHDEVTGIRGGASNGLLGFRSTGYDPVADQANSRYTFPAHMFIFTEDYACATALASAVRTIGRAYCDAADNIQIESSLAVFNFNTDWDLTKHHCISIYWDLRTISSVDMKMWIDGEVVLDVSNMDWTGSKYDSVAGADGYSSISLNNYSNRSNMGPTLEGGWNNVQRGGTNYRYSDNYTIVNGPPQLCSKVGFPSSFNQAGL